METKDGIEHKTEILVVGTNESILATVLRLLNNNVAWKATGVSTIAGALASCKENVYQILMIGAGLTDEQEKNLAAQVCMIYPDIHIILHYGGGSGLLFAEIYLALGTKN